MDRPPFVWNIPQRRYCDLLVRVGRFSVILSKILAQVSRLGLGKVAGRAERA